MYQYKKTFDFDFNHNTKTFQIVLLIKPIYGVINNGNYES